MLARPLLMLSAAAFVDTSAAPPPVTPTPPSGAILVQSPSKLPATIPVLSRAEALGEQYDYKPTVTELKNGDLLMAFRSNNVSQPCWPGCEVRSRPATPCMHPPPPPRAGPAPACTSTRPRLAPRSDPHRTLSPNASPCL